MTSIRLVALIDFRKTSELGLPYLSHDQQLVVMISSRPVGLS
jgi:hypothetical protein